MMRGEKNWTDDVHDDYNILVVAGRGECLQNKWLKKMQGNSEWNDCKLDRVSRKQNRKSKSWDRQTKRKDKGHRGQETRTKAKEKEEKTVVNIHT